MIIAVDGPAASGKGTLAAGLAAHFGLPHLDTGLLYRAVGLAIAEAVEAPDFEAKAISTPAGSARPRRRCSPRGWRASRRCGRHCGRSSASSHSSQGAR
jgi:hypothetical protein